MMRSSLNRGGQRRNGTYWRQGVRHIEFPAAVETDLVGAMLDGEEAAQVPVMTMAEGELKNPKERVHRFIPVGVRSCHWHPATPEEREHWPGPVQSRSPQPRNKC